MNFPHGETVTRLRAPLTTSRFSGRTTEPDWDHPGELSIGGCAVADGGSVEVPEPGRDAVDSDFDVFMPAGTDVTAADRLEVRGLVCDVVGRPFLWRSPFTGWEPGTVVRCKIREG